MLIIALVLQVQIRVRGYDQSWIYGQYSCRARNAFGLATIDIEIARASQFTEYIYHDHHHHHRTAQNQCNFGLFLPTFGCHGNAVCSFKYSNISIFEFVNLENPIVHAKCLHILYRTKICAILAYFL